MGSIRFSWGQPVSHWKAATWCHMDMSRTCSEPGKLLKDTGLKTWWATEYSLSWTIMSLAALSTGMTVFTFRYSAARNMQLLQDVCPATTIRSPSICIIAVQHVASYSRTSKADYGSATWFPPDTKP